MPGAFSLGTSSLALMRDGGLKIRLDLKLNPKSIVIGLRGQYDVIVMPLIGHAQCQNGFLEISADKFANG